MESSFVIEAQGFGEGNPLHIGISVGIPGGRLEVLGFAPGKKVAIEESYGKITISLLEVLEAVPAPVQSVPSVPVPSAPVESPVQLEIAQQSVVSSEVVQHGVSLFQHLVSLRKQLSSEFGVPPYIIFHDVTLKEMALSMPSSLEALKSVQGVGSAKLEKYGSRFLKAISEYVQSQGVA
jgi:ATP-dependent DNA helicase RecQ